MTRAASLLLLCLLSSVAAGATTRYVAPGGVNAGDCASAAAPCATIAYAVSQSTDGDVIAVAAGTYAAGAVIGRDVTVEGAGQALTAVAGPFTINTGVTATLRALTVQGARVTNRGTAALEQVTVAGNATTGVDNRGTMTITASVIRDNINTRSYPAVAPNGGGIYNAGTLTVVETLVEGNRATNPDDFGSGGGIVNEEAGTATILRSTIHDNTADSGGGISNSAYGNPRLTVIASTISGNYANFLCGAVENFSDATLFNSTVSGNVGGLCARGGEITIENSTITANQNDGYWGYGAVLAEGPVRLRNTILAGNEDECSAEFGVGTLTSLDYNLIGDLGGSCTVTGSTAHNVYGAAPRLGPLADNGGPTLTHAPRPGSPAIDAGTCTDIGGDPVTEDQRGEPRPVGATCDIGAVERGGGIFLTITPSAPPVVLPPEGGAFTFTVAVMNGTAEPVTLDAWVEATRPDGEILTAPYGSLLGPITVALGPGETVERTLVQRVPANAMAGGWTYAGYAGSYPDGAVAADFFAAEKLPSLYTVTATLVSPPDGMLPGSGGPFTYEVEVTNVTDTTRSGGAWGVLRRPDGSVVDPYVGPRPFTLAPGGAFTYAATDSLGASDPAGLYTFAFFAGRYPDGATAADSFAITKVPSSVLRYVAPSGADGGNTCVDAASPCATIRHALGLSNDGDTIVLAAGTYTELGLEVDEDVTIRGAGAATTIVQAASSPGVATDRVFAVGSGVAMAAFEDLTIRHGVARDPRGGGGGGGIHVDGNLYSGIDTTFVAITRCVITGNSVTRTFYDYGGGLYMGFGTWVTITNSTIRRNRADPSNFGEGGGLYLEYGHATLINSTVSENTAADGGGIWTQEGEGLVFINSTISGNTADDGGGIYNRSLLVLQGSVVSGNVATSDGGAVYNAADVEVTNSTISGNMAGGLGGGLYSRRLVGSPATTRVTHSTIVSNTAGQGGGFYFGGPYTNDLAEMRGALLADNAASGGGPDCYTTSPGVLTSRDYNLIESTTGCTIIGTTTHDLYGVDPLLGPLADNGGPTLTHALLPGSPAVDAGTCTDLDGQPVAVDQRGAPRPFGPACDIGAFEFGAEPPLLAAAPVSAPEEAAALASAEVPAAYALLPAYPNPFRHQAKLRYGLPEAGRVRLAVYDLLGREVAVLVDAEREAGWHEAVLDGSRLAAGPYLYRLTAGGFREAGRVTVVR